MLMNHSEEALSRIEELTAEEKKAANAELKLR